MKRQLKIKDICQNASSSLKQKDVEGKNGTYPVYGASGLISKIDTFHQDKEYIAIVKDGSGIGRVSFMPAKSSIIGTMQYILPRTGFDIKYIGYCLKSLNLAEYKQGAAIPHIYFKEYGERLVNVTDSIPEQQSIVARLDSAFAKIDALKANAQKQLDEAKALFQSTLKQLLSNIKTDNIKKLDGITNIIKGYAFPSDEFNPRNKNYAIKITNVGVNEFVVDESNKVSDKYNDVANIQVNTGDIVIALTRTIISSGIKVALVPPLYDNAFVNQRVAGIKAKDENVDFQFLYYYLSSDEIYKYILKHVNTLMQPNLSIKDLKNMPIPLPSLDEQKSIVEKLDAISSRCRQLEENYTKTIALCDDMKQALLRETFE